MKQHPFLDNSHYQNIFPSQNIPLKKKDEEWKRVNMNYAEWEGRRQYLDKLPLWDNYRLANDELIEKDYGKESPSFDLIEKLTEDSGVPDVIKNYGILSQPIATLEGEMDNFPDVFNVKGVGDIFESEKERVKTQLLKDWFMNYMNQSVEEKLMEMQEDDPDAELFQDEEQYQKAFQDQMQVMFPAKIQKYMNTEYKHVLEIWGQHELKDQFERFKLKVLRRKDFYHWLRVAQRFRHLYVGPKGLKVETLNPMFVFCRKSPNIDYVQDGDLAGFIQLLTVPAIIDRYRDLLTDEQINSLEKPYESVDKNADIQKRPDGSKIDYLHPKGVPYQTRIMSDDPKFYSLFPDTQHMHGMLNGLYLNDEERSKIDGIGNSLYITNSLQVTTAYWRSQRRIGKLKWINPITNLEEVTLIDETFDLPKGIKQIKNEKFNFDAGLNTVIWTRETEIWQGVKISNYGNINLLDEPIYLDIKPAEIQIGKLPIAGHFANNINTKPTSLVDKAKSFQWLFNVLINQTVLYVQTEILPFIVMSSGMIPTDKDWGGEDAYAKWMSVAQWLGAGVIEGGVGPNGTADNAGGQFPREINLDRSTRILSRIQLALQIKQLALDHIGISPQRMGAVKSTETATGVNQAISNSGVQTSSWFTSFFEGEKEMLQLQLDAAKFLQARGKQIDTLNKSELSLEALRLALEDESLYDLHVYVTDSQEELRNLQVARQLALENNTSQMAMSDRIKLTSATSITEIIEELKESERQELARQQQEFQLRQQELQQQGLQAQAALEQAAREKQAEIDKDIRVAIIQAMGRNQNIDVDANGNADLIEMNKLINTANQIQNNLDISNKQLELEERKHQDSMSLEERKRRDEREKNKFELALEDKKLKRDIVRGDKSK